ncbi:MAG: hypothetical protein U9N37_04090, partial [Thermodesulfobacteriota bacterium]|nr:hypothetical protein [Thermodesulfobacteriota bacterium]
FMQPAAEEGSAFVPWVGSNLDDILCEHHQRTVTADNCRFWSKPATHSGTKLPLIPGETCHPFRRKVYHFSGHFRNAESIS